MTTNDRDPSLVAELGRWLYAAFCAPGDYCLTHLAAWAPTLARMHADSLPRGTPWAALVSALVWIAACVLAISLYRALRDLHVTVCGYAARGYGAWLRLGRNVARRQRLLVKSRSWQRRTRMMQPMISEEVELGEFALAVLRCQSRLPAGHTLTASDIARVLRVRAAQAQSVLERLTMLELVDTAVGVAGRSGYRLSLSGKLYLAAYDRRPLPAGVQREAVASG